MRCVMVIIAVLIGLICILIFSDNIFHNHHKPTRGIEDGKISGRYRSKDPKEQNLQGVRSIPVRATQKIQVHQMPSKGNPDIKSQPSPKSPVLNRVGINQELQGRKKNTEDGKPNIEERKPTLEGRKPNSEDRNRNLEDRRRNRIERILRRQNMTVNQRPDIIRRVQGSGFSRRQNMTVNQRPDIIRRVQGSGFGRRQDISKRPDRFNSITNSRNSGERRASTTAQRKELLRSVKKNPELKDALCNKEAWGKYFPCMTVQPQPSLNVPICTYKPTENSPTSKTMSSGKYWEWKGVSAIIEQLTQHPQADFIDIGASIGAYSLAVVHALKRHTIAVEPNNQSTRRMAVAACHAEVYKHITLLNRGILDAKSAMNVTMSDKDPESLDFKTSSASCAGCRKRVVQVITLNDLINKVKSTQAVIKVDTNGNEFRIFTDSAAGNFFTRIQVPAVLIDMEYYVNKQSLPTEARQKADATIKFFSSRNYEPRKLDGKTALNSNWQEWPAQVLFVKTGNKVSR